MNDDETAPIVREAPAPPEVSEKESDHPTLIKFIQDGWHVLEPGNTFVSNWHLEAIAEHLEAVSDGQIRNLLINMPPRHGKSLAVSVFWPMWEWTFRPQCRWMFSSYSLHLAVRDSVKCRRLVLSAWYQEAWGKRFKLQHDQNTKERFENTQGGHRVATSVDGSATGEGGDRIVVDDPHNVAESESRLAREEVLQWWDLTMSTRLNNPKEGGKVIVMQRLHEKDLSGHVLRQGGYDHLCLPAEFERARAFKTSLERSDRRAVEGELLWSARFGANEIDEAKLRLGPSGYAGQFQQRPVPDGGARFRADWFRYYTLSAGGDYHLLQPDGSTKIVVAERCDRFATMDPAGTEASQNTRACYTVIQVWDVTPDAEMVLVHQYRKQVQTPDAAEAAQKVADDYKIDFLAVEKDGIGLGIVQTLKRAGMTVRPIKARGSKEARSEIAEIRMAAGWVYFPKEAKWRWDLEQELLHFPAGEDADQVDALAHAAMLVGKKAGSPKAARGVSTTKPQGDALNEIINEPELTATIDDSDSDWQWTTLHLE